MAYQNKDQHTLHTNNSLELKQRNQKFISLMNKNLAQRGIYLNTTEKTPFTDELKKGLSFVEITKNKNVLAIDKTGELRELKFKGASELARNLKLGDQFDYVVKDTKEPKLNKDGKPLYIKGKPQFKKERLFENIVTLEQQKKLEEERIKADEEKKKQERDAFKKQVEEKRK